MFGSGESFMAGRPPKSPTQSPGSPSTLEYPLGPAMAGRAASSEAQGPGVGRNLFLALRYRSSS